MALLLIVRSDDLDNVKLYISKMYLDTQSIG